MNQNLYIKDRGYLELEGSLLIARKRLSKPHILWITVFPSIFFKLFI